MRSSSPVRTPKLHLTAEKPLTGECWIPPKKDTPCPQAKEKPHQDGSVQFSSVAQWCPTLCDPMNHSTPGRPVHHQLPEFTQTHIHRVRDAIQPSHPLPSPSLAFNLSHPASWSFPRSQFFASGGQSIGVSASTSILPMNIQG